MLKNYKDYNEFKKSIINKLNKITNELNVELIVQQQDDDALSYLIVKSIKTPGAKFCIEYLYEDYLKGSSIRKIIKGIEHRLETPKLPDEYFTKEYVEKNIFVKLVNKELVENKLEHYHYHNVDCTEFVALYRILLCGDTDVIGSYGLHNELVTSLDLNVDDTFYKNAIKNTEKLFPLCIESLADIAKANKMGIAEEMNSIFIVTNEQHSLGSSVILYEDACEKVRNKIGSDYYLLPVSVDAFIAIDKGIIETMDDLEKAITQISENAIPIEHLLGRYVYDYTYAFGAIRPVVKAAV